MIIKHAALGHIEISDKKIEKRAAKLRKQAALEYLVKAAAAEIAPIYEGMYNQLIEKLAYRAIKKAEKKAVKVAEKAERQTEKLAILKGVKVAASSALKGRR